MAEVRSAIKGLSTSCLYLRLTPFQWRRAKNQIVRNFVCNSIRKRRRQAMFEFEVCNKMLFGANCEQMRVNELCHRFIVLVGEFAGFGHACNADDARNGDSG